MRTLIFVTCDGYWRRMRPTMQSIARASLHGTGHEAHVYVATTDGEDVPAWAVEWEHSNTKLNVVHCYNERRHAKPSLLAHAFEYGLVDVEEEPDAIIIADADIIYPPDLFTTCAASIGGASMTCASGERVHVTLECAEQICISDMLPEEDRLAHIISEYEDPAHTVRNGFFMGWLQAFTPDMIGCLPFSEYACHDGYDEFDYECAKRLMATSTRCERLVWERRPPIHLGHGHWGANWRGVSRGSTSCIF